MTMELRVTGIDLPESIDSARYIEENRQSREFMRRVTEARALEYAGDAEGATAIYESLIKTPVLITVPYQRLAIIYAKAKRTADEERVVRAALAAFPCGPNSWFVLRLAKIIAKKSKPAP